ncbi:MAG: 16S rRNA (guanine(966)-N(2))-methyltransferase RsmD [Ignavibacteria bacterium]|nr:16S rRNA (guanine(966)-N(2))-methyltransferase RsmD [Ignavibacteria bacterium]
MRIVAGSLKGRKFKFAVPNGVRPTQDSVRETIFNILDNHFDFQNSIVADICAGTGAFGFEALSRGAEKVYFIEKNRNAVSFIRNTTLDFHLSEDVFKLINHDALKILKRMNDFEPGIKFDLAFIDPPYELKLGNSIVNLLLSENLISDDGIIIVESDSFDTIFLPESCNLLTERSFGETKVSFLQKKI